MTLPPLLVLGGPTAVGKTARAVQWAQTFDGEIVNADSRQIYRYMDIGTAKPSPEEQAQAPHHLLDLVTPDQTLTLSAYQAQAQAVFAAIWSRGRLPILCGGTGLYLTAIMEGWQAPEVPPEPRLRAELESQSAEALFARLQALDPVTAAQIDRHNLRRLVRALEVVLVTGESFSAQKRKSPPPYNILALALDMERSALYAQADRRLAQMIAGGWLAEIESLAALGYTPPLPALSALGYPQMFAVWRGEQTLAQAQASIAYATHHFIRRQYTWLRGHPPPHQTDWTWLAPSDDARPLIQAWLNRVKTVQFRAED
jgi:tRNA dimethylallyltransferase